MGTAGKPRSWRRWLIHAVRVALFAAIVVMIHRQHERFTSAQQAQPQQPLSLEQIRHFFPTVASIESESAENIVRDAAGEQLGTLLQTSPTSDHIIGFSGPTNVLIAIDTNDQLLGIEILSSDDTRDHVRQIRKDAAFFASFVGRPRGEATGDVDAVSGATLTSLAITEAVMHRLGGAAESLRFPQPLTLADAQQLFPTATALKKDESSPALWHVQAADEQPLGTLLRTSPAADNIVGYQGPTETRIAFDPHGRVIGIALGNSYDNEPYVTYVREDEYFLSLFNDLNLDRLATLDLQEANVEGVSGATMTSMAVAAGLVQAAQQEKLAQEAAQQRQSTWNIAPHDYGTAAVIVAAVVIGMTRLRSQRTLRVIFQCVLIGYLGLIAGNLVSMAMLVGWAQNGIAWRSASGLVILTAAALLLPMTTRRNLYCSHICPHGAAQDLLKRRLSWQLRIPKRLARALLVLPALLLAWCVIVGMLVLSVSLVDIEPFDAWVFRVAGLATISVAVVGLIASLFVPMAYCRYGCPTGALLKFLRVHSHSERWTARDWAAVGLAGLAFCLSFT
ncbi:Putative electron transport protein YccM [Symmachiella dynata]|uniref:Electron transport protein YccM n=1 Tax=Symmachiella dynata TaxID=2527995 RepID=A0A517ZYM1_9PLAN|nr:FMN-binding protein [Symmachiella dynata]QDU47551.1 Putative electron transport protein YccM [Symmachiella dynata]